MIKATLKRKLLNATLAVSAAFTMAGPAMAQYHQGDETLYFHYYYSDSSYTEQVGQDHDTCNWYGVGRSATVGSWSQYEQTEPWARCVNGQLAPIM